MQNANTPAINGDVTQLLAISPSLIHSTELVPFVISANPTIAPTIE